jgi:hypothetical protein
MQKSFPDLEDAAKKKLTRRDRLLAEIDSVTPQGQAQAAQADRFVLSESGRRPPIGLARMLRMYIAQQCFGLSVEGIEEEAYDSQFIRAFVALARAASRRGTRRPCCQCATCWKQTHLRARSSTPSMDVWPRKV